MLGVVATLFVSLGALAMARVAALPEVTPGLRLVPRMVVEALATGALAPLVSAGMKWIDGMFRREDPGLLR